MCEIVTINVQFSHFVLWLEVSFHSAHCGQAHSHVTFLAREVRNEHMLVICSVAA